METDEAESWNGNRKQKAGMQNWSGKLERAADVWKWSPKTNARVCDNCSKLMLTGSKMEVRGSESVLILEPVLFAGYAIYVIHYKKVNNLTTVNF